jgi:hypothetical protein
VACGPRPNDERNPATSATTAFGRGAGVVVGAANAASAGKAEGVGEKVGADSVVAVEDALWTDGAADGFCAATPLPPEVDGDDTAVVDAFELTMLGGCAALFVVVPLGPSF